MAIFNTIAFPEPDWVTGFPTFDGWTGNEDAGVAATFPEPGYATADRITYAGGGAVAPVVFQAMYADITNPATYSLPVAAGTYLVMGFFCTFDPTWDIADGVTIALRPDFSSTDHTTERRIDLLPNSDGIGAGAPGGGYDTLPGQAANYYARLNRTLASGGPVCWKGVGTNPAPTTAETRWQSIVVDNVYARAASWLPSTVTATAAASQTVPTTTLTSSSPFTIQVDDLSQFPDAGDLLVPISGNPAVEVAYTGRNTGTNTFTGCTVRKSTTGGTVDTATPVQRMDVGWSIEALIPATSALGGGDWITLLGHFGIYINLFRYSLWEPQPAATPYSGHLAAQYRFPLPDAFATDQQFITGTLTDPTIYIGGNWYGKATIPAITGSNDALGVSFQNVVDPTQSVGARHGGSSTLDNTIDGTQDNTLVAQIKNTGTSGATNVTAEFRFGKYGNPPTAFDQWAPSASLGATTPTVVNLSAAGAGSDSAEVTSDWPGADVPAIYTGDTCLWARLTSPDSVNFVQDGVRKNFYFVNLSEHTGDATVSGTGYPTPSSGSHDFLLMEHVRSIATYVRGDERTGFLAAARPPAATGGDGQQVVKEWYWAVETFRRTGLHLTVNGVTGEVIDPGPGEFALVATHSGGPDDVVITRLTGGGLRRSGRFFELKVPHNGEVTIQRWIGAGAPGTLNPPPIPPAVPAGAGKGCLAWILGLIAVIAALFKKK